jgi:hypothetical protein
MSEMIPSASVRRHSRFGQGRVTGMPQAQGCSIDGLCFEKNFGPLSVM